MTTSQAAAGTAPLAPPTSRPLHRAILVATDGSEASAPALVAARLLAARLGAPVQVVSVVPPERIVVPVPEGFTFPVMPVAEQLAHRRDRVRDEMLRVLGSTDAWPLDVRSGLVSHELADLARETDALLVITGLVHHGRMDRALRGETPLAILNDAGVPVLAVPPGVDRLPRSVVLAVDATDATLDAAAFVRPLLADAESVYLVHVQSPLDVAPPMMAPGSDRAYHDAMRRAFDRVGAAIELPPKVQSATRVLAGDVATEVLDFAEFAKAELVVCGHRRRPLIERFISRGTAARLFHGATTWLLMVPEDARHRGHLAATDETEANAMLRDRSVWATFLAAFTARNLGRRAELQVHDLLGAQTVVRGYPFLGADYEPDGVRVDLMLGDGAGTDRHLRHTVRHTTALQVHRGADGRDGALRVADRFGQALLTFLP